MTMQRLSRASRIAAVLFAAVFAATALAQAPTRILGVITEIRGNILTLKSDNGGAISTVTVPETAKLLRIAPGQKDISAAQPIEFNTLQPGDRVLVRLAPSADSNTAQTADRVIAIKQEDLAEKQRADLEDWQKRGILGIVRSVDATSGDIVVSTGGSQSARTLTLHTAKSTIVRRYAPNSTQFADAHIATLAEIHKGDQLRARGNKSEDGLSLTAEEIVSGTFHTYAGTVVSVDADSFVVTDLATKKPLTVVVKEDSRLRKLPDEMAQRMAARLSAAGQPGAAKPAQHSGNGTAHGNQNPEALINMAPEFKLPDLKKGDALLLLTTEGTPGGPVTAVTVLAGVEPVLRAAPGAMQSMMLSSWSMGSGNADTAP